MTRNLKTLGLALMVTAAFSALVTSGAQAAPTFSAATAGEWHPTGTPLGTHQLTLAFGASLECGEVHFDPTQTYTGAQTKVRATPTYRNCSATIFAASYPVTVTHNGCEFEFHATRKIEANTYEGRAQVICPVEVNGIELHIYQAADTTHSQAPRCTFTVKPQTINGILTHNDATDVDLTANTASVFNTRTSGSLLQCGSESQIAEYHGATTVTATGPAGTVKGTIAGE
jgi:hypothetical protein